MPLAHECRLKWLGFLTKEVRFTLGDYEAMAHLGNQLRGEDYHPANILGLMPRPWIPESTRHPLHCNLTSSIPSPLPRLRE